MRHPIFRLSAVFLASALAATCPGILPYRALAGALGARKGASLPAQGVPASPARAGAVPARSGVSVALGLPPSLPAPVRLAPAAGASAGQARESAATARPAAPGGLSASALAPASLPDAERGVLSPASASPLPDAPIFGRPPLAAPVLGALAEKAFLPRGASLRVSDEDAKTLSDFDGDGARPARSSALDRLPLVGRWLSSRRRAKGGSPAALAPASSSSPSQARSAEAAASVPPLSQTDASPAARRSLGERLRAFGAEIARAAFGDKGLRHFLKPYKGKIILSLSAALVSALAGFGMAQVGGVLIDLAGKAPGSTQAFWLAGALTALLFVRVAAVRIYVYLDRMLGIWMARDYRDALNRKLLSQDLSFHQENKSTALAARLRDDTNHLSNKNFSVPMSLAQALPLVLIGVVLMFWTQPLLGLLLLPLIVLIAYGLGVIGEKMTPISFEKSNAKADLAAQAQEIFQQAATIKSLATTEAEIERYARDHRKLTDLELSEARLGARWTLLSSATAFISHSLIYLVGGWLLGAWLGISLSLGQLTALSVVAGYLTAGLGEVFSNWLYYKRYHGATEIARRILTSRPSLEDAPGAEALGSVDGHIRFEDVVFAYGEAAEPVLRGLGFEAKPGQTVALVGETGSGKSTATSLLLRLWRPRSGRVLLDGKDVWSVRRKDILDHVSVVLQERRLRNETVRFNLTYGVGEVSEERLREALRLAKADFLFDAERFPQGLETKAAEGGGRLSGGERQRIAVARAILKRAEILVLDEATSALDNESERSVQAALDNLVRGTAGRRPTTLVIAHRLSTVRKADLILVLERGQVVERGTHEELLALGGRYHKLWMKGDFDQGSAQPKASALGQWAAALALGLAAAAAFLGAPALPLGLAVLAWGAGVLASALALAFGLAGRRIAWALKKHLASIESAGPRGPGRFWSRITRAIATPSSYSPAFSLLPLRYRRFLEAHESAHRRGAGEWGATLAQFGPALKLLALQAKALRLRVKRTLRSVKNFAFGDKVVKPYLKPYRKSMAWAVALTVLDAAAAIASVQALRLFLGAYGAHAAAGALGVLAAATFGLYAVHAFSRMGHNWLVARDRASLIRDLRVALVRSLMSRPMSFFSKQDSGALAGRINDEGEALAEKNLSLRVPQVKNVLLFVASAALMLQMNLLAGGIIIASILVFAGLNGVFSQQLEDVYKKFQKFRAQASSFSQEIYEHIQTVKVFGQEEVEAARYRGIIQNLAELGGEDAKIRSRAGVFSGPLAEFMTRLVPVILGALAGVSVGLSVPEIVGIVFLAKFFQEAFANLSGSSLEYKQARGVTGVVRSWLRWAQQDTTPELPPIKGRVSFEAVTFAYKAEEGAGNILNGLSFEIEPGSFAALVGPTGSGKSTVFSLLQGLWRPQAGRIRVDGYDTSEFSAASLNRQIAVVSQDVRLFNDTLRYNMLYGTFGAGEEELHKAIRAAKADFVFDKALFPLGLDTPVGEGGAKLSGGQKQRVAIVRALLRKAPILLLDEATAALDKETELEIQKTLDALRRGEGGFGCLTVLAIAHNLTTIQGADRILVLKRGALVESGTHAELLAKEGEYARLWSAAKVPQAPPRQ